MGGGREGEKEMEAEGKKNNAPNKRKTLTYRNKKDRDLSGICITKHSTLEWKLTTSFK